MSTCPDQREYLWVARVGAQQTDDVLPGPGHGGADGQRLLTWPLPLLPVEPRQPPEALKGLRSLTQGATRSWGDHEDGALQGPDEPGPCRPRWDARPCCPDRRDQLAQLAKDLDVGQEQDQGEGPSRVDA
jgi:hypothetical protein